MAEVDFFSDFGSSIKVGFCDDWNNGFDFWFNDRKSVLDFIEQLRQELTRDDSTLVTIGDD